MPKKKKTGFSLIELAVVVSIISILSVIVAANYRAGERQLALQRSAHQVAQDIRRAQAMAMGAVKCPPNIPACANQIPPGYGIHLRRGDPFYILYADINPLQGNQEYDDGGDAIIEIIELEKGVYIHSVTLNPLSVNFKPPDPTINIRGEGQEITEVLIVIALENQPTRIKTIKLNTAGLIEIE